MVHHTPAEDIPFSPGRIAIRADYGFGGPSKKMCLASRSFSQKFSMISVSGMNRNGTVTDHGFV
jgi:hypothetical protein